MPSARTAELILTIINELTLPGGHLRIRRKPIGQLAAAHMQLLDASSHHRFSEVLRGISSINEVSAHRATTDTGVTMDVIQHSFICVFSIKIGTNDH